MRVATVQKTTLRVWDWVYQLIPLKISTLKPLKSRSWSLYQLVYRLRNAKIGFHLFQWSWNGLWDVGARKHDSYWSDKEGSQKQYVRHSHYLGRRWKYYLIITVRWVQIKDRLIWRPTPTSPIHTAEEVSSGKGLRKLSRNIKKKCEKMLLAVDLIAKVWMSKSSDIEFLNLTLD